MGIFRPGDRLCIDQLGANVSTEFNANITIGEGPNSVCKVIPSPYYDMFAILHLAEHQGSGSVAGEPCEVWALSLKASGYESNVSACIAADGVPRQYNMTSNVAFKLAGSKFLTFSNISVGPPGDAAFEPSEVCRERWPMPPCPSSAVETLDLYRVRSPKEPNSAVNRNLGDALGDMAFFCDLSLDETQVVTHWAVEANNSWGQYGYCLYVNGQNLCFGSTGHQVGRESALGLGEGAVQGQCSSNEDVGSWFSLPGQGQCPLGAPVGTGGCTWAARALRTVSTACIMEERGLKAACARERGHAPMRRSAAIFRAALETADPAKGGCPDVGDASGLRAAEVPVLV